MMDTEDTSVGKQENWLDVEHQGWIQHLLDIDTEQARRELASHYTARLTDDIHSLHDDQEELGTAEQMAAIRNTGWTGWARFFVVVGWVVVLVDAVIWFVAGSRLLTLD